MKNKSILLGLLALMLAGLFIATNQKVQGNPNQPHQVVYLGSKVAFHYEGAKYVQDGFLVDWVDASPGCPVVPINSSFPAAIAYYMDLGFSQDILNYSVSLLRK